MGESHAGQAADTEPVVQVEPESDENVSNGSGCQRSIA
jgi:hypothetical protein